MGFRFPKVLHAKQRIQIKPFYSIKDVQKGYVAVYVGEEDKVKRFVIPVSHLNQPSFQGLLTQSKIEFLFDHPMGGLTIHCKEDAFIDLIASFNAL